MKGTLRSSRQPTRRLESRAADRPVGWRTMAQQALHPGTTQTRGRAFFGLLDANGWGWASLKAAFWFILLIFMLGYVPDRAYYFTVNKTIDLGILAWSPVNFCPEGNKTLPCPAPAGAVVPWATSPDRDRPARAADRRRGRPVRDDDPVRRRVGRDQGRPTKTFIAKTVRHRQLRQVGRAGPALPEPRVRRRGRSTPAARSTRSAASARTASRRRTVYVLTPDAHDRRARRVADRRGRQARPRPARGARRRGRRRRHRRAAPRRRNERHGPDRTPSGRRRSTSRPARPSKWAPQAGARSTRRSPTPRPRHRHVPLGLRRDRRRRQGRRRRSSAASSGPAPTRRRSSGSASSGGPTDLPAPRTNARRVRARTARSTRSAARTGRRPRARVYWAIPTNAGDITEWKHLDVSDLPATGARRRRADHPRPGRDHRRRDDERRRRSRASDRANIAPEAPFFQLGLVGATVPALKIDGEIGQQLGYLNANTIGIVELRALPDHRLGVRPPDADQGVARAPRAAEPRS